MAFSSFDGRDASKLGVALADKFAPQQNDAGVQELLEWADINVRTLRLNFYKKAKFANSFKWRLLEKGVDKAVAAELTQRLVMHLSVERGNHGLGGDGGAAPTDGRPAADARDLLAQGNACIARGDYQEAIAFYRDLTRLEPRNVAARNNLGAALSKLGHYKEAERQFREAVRLDPESADAHSNLGNLLRWRGETTESESWLRRALKLNPRLVDARINLGLTLAFMSRAREAKGQFEKAMKISPRNANALCGLAFVAKTEGRFDEASALFARVIEIDPRMSAAWAAQAGLRKMTSADGAWLDGAEQVANSGIGAFEEAELRFAMGKYCDDVGNFKQAFDNYQRANRLLKSMAEPYDRAAHVEFVGDLIRLFTRETLAQSAPGASNSNKPVFVVGMPRSGTSLTEQIIASHPSASGAGELPFWSDTVRTHAAAIRDGSLGEHARSRLAESYLRILETHAGEVTRVVDKAPVNSDHLGLIHSIFPRARIIYMQRDPIDTCLSCYFQQFTLGMTFTMDLSDLAHYYKQHQRLMTHWREALPPGTILDVPYEQLVADQEGWTRKILEFLGLEWTERCLNYHQTDRAVVTSSFWQVRQKIYKNSVLRWRNYERCLGPLLTLGKP